MKHSIKSVVAMMMVAALALPAMAQTTQPAATRPATRANPLATPASAVEHLFTLLQKKDYAAMRRVLMSELTVTEVQRQFGVIEWALDGGCTFEIVDSHNIGAVAAVLLQLSNETTGWNTTATFIAIQRYDDWKVELGEPNLRKLTPTERENYVKVLEWSQKRLASLPKTAKPATRATRAATQPANE